jgi:hypothetical protein
MELKLTDYLAGLVIGTSAVPIIDAGELEPLSSDPEDERRTIKVTLVLPNGAELIDERKN